MIAIILAAALSRDPALLHKNLEPIVAAKEQEQEQTLRKLLELGGSPTGQAEVLARLAGFLRARGLALFIRAQAEADAGDEAAAARDKTRAADARAEAISRYRELIKKYPQSPKLDEALFFLADTLQDSGRDAEAVAAARELTKRFPKSIWAPASHVFIGEHWFDEAKLAEALKEYQLAAEVTEDETYPYALYKAAWCRFNQSAFDDAMKLLKKVVDVSAKAGDVNTVQLSREARRDYVLAYGRIGKPEQAHNDFVKNFGPQAGLKMLEQYGKLLFDTGRDPEAQLIARQLLSLHGDSPAAALDQTRLLVIAQRTGKRRDLLAEAKNLVHVFEKVRKDEKDEALAEANRLGAETLRNLSVQIHNEARKTDLDETWAAARQMYGDFLRLFPDAPDANDLRYFYGELLYSRGAKAEAAEQYEAVVKHGQSKWLQKAAWSAVLSRNEAIFGDQKETKDTGERRAQRALTADEQKLAAACRLYLEALPQGPHAVEVAFKVGRFEYVSNDLVAAEKHLSSIALNHPEHELAEFSANLVLDISNLRKDWPRLHEWAVKFLGDKRLIAHGTLAQDLKRIEEESAYALADAVSPDPAKAEALGKFAAEHPHGTLADKALFGAAAALSRVGRIDDALAARQRVWKEQPQSPLVPRALLASAADLNAVGDLGEAAALLEQYARGYEKEQATRKWRRDHPAPNRKPFVSIYDETKAQTGLHDAAILREARGELRQAIADRSLTMKLWKKSDDEQLAIARLREKMGESARAAREFAEIAKSSKGAVQISAWATAARLFTKAHETGNAAWSWTQTEKAYKALPAKAREKLPEDAVAAAAAAHFALGTTAFDGFRKQEIKAPLMATLNRKIALLQAVKKRTEETVSLRQAEPAVCALSQLGEAQMLLGKALEQSPFPPGLNAEQKKLYRAMLTEKAQPIYAEGRDTLAGADLRARELGVTGACPAKVTGLLEKLGTKAAPRPQLELARAPIADTPEMVDERDLQSEKTKRLLSEALALVGKVPPDQLVAKFESAAGSREPGAVFDLAISLDKAGRASEAEKAYRAVAEAANGALGFDAAARLAALAASRGDANAARDAVALADKALPGHVATRVLRADVELSFGNPVAAQGAARIALQQNPVDVRALCAMARAHLAQNAPGIAKLLAARAEAADPHDAEPILVKMEVARAAKDPAAEMAAARAALEADPDSPPAALALGRVLYEHGQTDAALNQLEDAAAMDPASFPAALAYGQALAETGETQDAEDELTRAAMLAPRAPEPHLELARIKLDGEGDAQEALKEAKLFLTLSTQPPPPGHPIHALVQRCEEALKQRAQASVVQ